MARKVSVDFTVDDYSTADKLWKWLKEPVTSSSHTSKRSLIRTGSISFDYFEVNYDDEKTPLMISVEKNFIKTTFNLLLYNSNPNLQQKETGDTALHMAVDNANITLVKALLAFNADPTILNNRNEIPLDIAANLKQHIVGIPDITTALGRMFSFNSKSFEEQRPIKKEALKGDIDGIIQALNESTRLRAKSHNYFTEHSTIPAPSNSSDIFLLSFDGGGMRNLIIGHILVNIEDRMSVLTSTKQHLYTYFDYFAGTSAGGLAACALAYLESDAINVRALLSRMNFVISSSMAEKNVVFDTTMQNAFTEDRSMADLDPRYRVIVTASLAEYIPYELHLMTSYGEPRDGQAGPKERKVWEAARITSSPPLYTPLLRDLKLLDGGLVCNNPTVASITEIIEQGKREGKPVKFGCVVSIGTGISPKKGNTEAEFFAPSLLSMLSCKNIYALQNLIQHYLNQTTLSNGKQVTRAQSFCEALGCQYFRLTPPLKEDVSMSTVDETILIPMLYDTQMYYLDNPELIDGVAKYLLSK